MSHKHMEVHTAQDRMINLLTCLGITVLWTQNLCIYQCARHCWGVAGNWIPVSVFLALHKEITRTGLSGPQFHAPLHNFTPPPGPAAGPSAAAFDVTLLILVLEIPFSFQFDMLGMSILMSVSKSTQILSKFYFYDTPEQDQRAWEQ